MKCTTNAASAQDCLQDGKRKTQRSARSARLWENMAPQPSRGKLTSLIVRGLKGLALSAMGSMLPAARQSSCSEAVLVATAAARLCVKESALAGNSCKSKKEHHACTTSGNKMLGA